jgi:Cd2+/Zn2+-exporting ATPase
VLIAVGSTRCSAAISSVWLYRALVLLVIGCPCSLVISTPVTVVAAIASAARQGVLLKGGSFVEIPATLTAIALDKTGDVDRGPPRVVEVMRARRSR